MSASSMRGARVLVTGFGPFGEEPRNPSGEIAAALDGHRLADGSVVRGIVLPVAFGSARTQLDAELAEHLPVLALGLGLAASRPAPSLERVAINLADAPIPDHDGAQPIDRRLTDDGPAACFSTISEKRVASALAAAGHAVELSLSAGSFVCNAVFYALLERLAPLGVPAGFMHLPRAEVWAMPRQIDAVRLALDYALACALEGPAAAPGFEPDVDLRIAGLRGRVD